MSRLGALYRCQIDPGCLAKAQAPGARAEPATLMGGRSGGESMDPQPAPTCRHGRKPGAPEA